MNHKWKELYSVDSAILILVNSNMKNFDLDLQALEVPKKSIRMPNGEVVFVSAPSLQDLLRLGKMAKNWKSLADDKGKKIDNGEKFDLVENFVGEIEKIIPPIKGHSLSIDSLMKIVSFVMALAEPAHTKELERRGISIGGGDGKKKGLR